jgi:hypothetical protein
LTDKNGRYNLQITDGDIIFVIKPSEYDFLEGKSTHKPTFYRIIGESSGFGDNLTDINFPLIKSRIRDSFSAIFLGDMQVTNDEEINYLRDSIIPELIDQNATFVLTLGDNANNNLQIYPRLTQILGQIGKTIYYLPGNHDTNNSIEGPNNNYNIYKKFFGPDYYSFNYGNVHFIVLNDVKWENGNYHGELGEKQFSWIREDLKYVPKDSLIVLAMHIPLISWVDRNNAGHHVKDRQELFNLLSGFENVIALSGHTHDLERLYPGDVIDNWSNGLAFPQIIAGATCGSWWGGEKDEFGVPYSYMKDGTPKGYFVFSFHDNKFEDTYKVAGEPANYQTSIALMNNNEQVDDSIINKDEIINSKIIANVFNADIYSEVSISFDDTSYLPMERDIIIDPLLNEKLMGRTIPVESIHIWSYNIPSTMMAGVHTAKVKFIDRYGKKYISSKIFEIK